MEEIFRLNEFSFERQLREWINRDKYDGMFIEIVVPGDDK